ncbi:MAG: carbonic anhydrase family protein [Sulfurihydrogenibium sp.]|jgi:carbonic anhydrase|nr:carbonic anhydrase family protein [Sulfurihydrogenibium sp.]
MRKILISTVLVLSSISVSFAEHEWSYEGEKGPEHWAQLKPEFFWCKLKNQSPINIEKKYTVKARLPKLSLYYKPAKESEVANNGHTIQINIKEDNTLNYLGERYQLKQFHFHTPSEHTIEKKSYPLEIHFVHKTEDGKILVVGVMAKLGKANKELDKILNVAPAEEGEKILDENLNLNNLMPKDKRYITYSDSLTTPPCTEGVRWIVLKKPISISKQQLEKLKSVMANPNNRSVQEINQDG